MLKVKLLKLLGLSALLLLGSCAEEEFGKTTKSEAISANSKQSFSSSSCAQSTLIKPPVDFLFVFDNSTSTNFINSQTKDALRNTLSFVSEKFDYHVMVAPLVRNSSNINEGASLAVQSIDGLNSSAQSLVVANDSDLLLDRVAAITTVPGSSEFGFSRVNELISTNRSNGIFRNNAYTIIVVISNEDADWVQIGPDNQGSGPEQLDFNTNKNNLISLSNSMSSEQFRFITLVPSVDNCQPFYKRGQRYKNMSQEIYLHNQTKPGFFDPSGGYPFDNFDICSGNYAGIFDSINQTIQEIVLSHVYDHWLITTNNIQTFDPNTIEVFKHINGGSTAVSIAESNFDGWSYAGYQVNKNTRVEPSPGEPQTGFMIRLNGNAKVTHPDCLRIDTLAPADYYGYVAISEEPDLSSVNFSKNGQAYNQSASNGWEYLGFQSSFNIRITGPGNYSPATPAVNRTGYIFKLNGGAAYSNGDSIDIFYFAAPK